MTFVIATVSTTDYDGKNPIETYDIYLKPVGQRTSAWWSPHASDAQMWATRAEAQAEWDRVFTGKRESSKVKELVEGWRPIELFVSEDTKAWYIACNGEKQGPYNNRVDARMAARTINDELRATGATVY